MRRARVHLVGAVAVHVLVVREAVLRRAPAARAALVPDPAREVDGRISRAEKTSGAAAEAALRAGCQAWFDFLQAARAWRDRGHPGTRVAYCSAPRLG